jgi:hypothetical protein
MGSLKPHQPAVLGFNIACDYTPPIFQGLPQSHIKQGSLLTSFFFVRLSYVRSHISLQRCHLHVSEIVSWLDAYVSVLS